MARDFVMDVFYCAYVTHKTAVGYEYTQTNGPYETIGTAQSMLTRAIKNRTDVVASGLRKGTVVWEDVLNPAEEKKRIKEEAVMKRLAAKEAKEQAARDKFFKELNV